MELKTTSPEHYFLLYGTYLGTYLLIGQVFIPEHAAPVKSASSGRPGELVVSQHLAPARPGQLQRLSYRNMQHHRSPHKRRKKHFSQITRGCQKTMQDWTVLIPFVGTKLWPKVIRELEKGCHRQCPVPHHLWMLSGMTQTIDGIHHSLHTE